MPAPKTTRVAIIGGGYAGLAAAWDLTSRDNPVPCEVTVFQMGGRLGGKGASSRNPDAGDRIEEHGLHLWLGYYENAFRMVRTCYTELRQAPATGDSELDEHLAGRPFDNWDWLAAFERAGLVALADDSSGDWLPWVARFPEYVLRDEHGVRGVYEGADGRALPGVHLVDDASRAYPGEESVFSSGPDSGDSDQGALEKPNVALFLTHALRELQAFIDSLELRVQRLQLQPRPLPMTDDPQELLSHALNAGSSSADEGVGTGPVDMLGALRRIRLAFLAPAIEAFATVATLAQGPLPFVRDRFVAMLDIYIDSMRDKIEFFVQADAAARRIWELIDLLAANIRGIIAAGLQGQDDFSSLDEFNYADWLRMNRMSERTLRNPIVRGAHDLGFAYRDGNPADAQIAAGQALNAGFRFFFMYKGALFWRMKAGMGDVVFAPLYLALRRRGVKFRFFHRLDDIDLAADGKTVNGLKFWRQARLKVSDIDAPTNYEPLVRIDGQNISAWSTKPDGLQFANAAEAPTTLLDFESIWCEWKQGDAVFATVGDQVHERPDDPAWVGHYDKVVVTVPVAALGRVSQQLADAPTAEGARWRAMLDNIGTVATQAVQLWVREPTHTLGWTYGQVSFSGFVHPFDTWADLSHLVEVENQPDARGAHYFCSVLPETQIPPGLRGPVRSGAGGSADRDRTDQVKAARDVVKENAKRFLEEWLFQLWPEAVRRYPNVFKWHLLVGGETGAGAEPLDTQHIVANVDPSHRYTQSLPGTTKYRLRPDDSGFTHLVIAGDWTECGLNFGCVEAAVVSGRLASATITGFPNTHRIPNYERRMNDTAAAQGGR